MLNHDVLDDSVRVDLVLVGDGIAHQFIEARRLKTERFEIKGRAAAFPSSSFEGLDELCSDASTAIRRLYPELLQLAALAPPATHSAANYTALLRAREA